MDSTNLSVLNFSGWLKFNRAHERLILQTLPTLKGIYAVRGRRSEALLRGSSDIVYLGCAANEDGLRKRVQEYFHPGISQATCKRINGLVMSCDDYDLSFATALDADCAKHWECAILNAFLLDHGQLPSQNRRNPTGMTRDEVEVALQQWAIYANTVSSSGLMAGE